MPLNKGDKVKPGVALSRGEIDNIIQALKTPEDKAMFMVQYLTASRISEVLSLYKQDFITENIGKKKYLTVTMKVMKRRKHVNRKVLIPFEDKFVPFILDYINNTRTEEKLFDISKNLAWKRLTKAAPHMRTHIFRHSRITELVTKYNFSVFELIKFVGWTNSAPANIYTHLMTKDIADRFEDSEK